MSASPSEFDRVCAAADAALSRSPVGPPRLGLVLGSGLGSQAQRLGEAAKVPYTDLPGFPTPAVPGHAGLLVFGRLGRLPVVLLQGRVHLYEGWSPAEVVFGVRVLGRLGIEALLLSNAAGAVRADLAPGDLMRITDHINLTGRNPLVGEHDERFGPRFPDLSGAYSRELGRHLDAAAAAAGVPLASGVYCQFLGPSYETPAEVRAARVLGADAVGMSTVPEVIAACQAGVPVAAVSCITNRAAGLAGERLSHDEVIAFAARAGRSFGLLLDAFAARLG